MSDTRVHGCTKCQGCLEQESRLQWRCLNCGKRLWTSTPQRFTQDLTVMDLSRYSDDDILPEIRSGIRRRAWIYG